MRLVEPHLQPAEDEDRLREEIVATKQKFSPVKESR